MKLFASDEKDSRAHDADGDGGGASSGSSEASSAETFAREVEVCRRCTDEFATAHLLRSVAHGFAAECLRPAVVYELAAGDLHSVMAIAAQCPWRLLSAVGHVHEARRAAPPGRCTAT